MKNLMNVLVCPKCGAINNRDFVMYYGDGCCNCDYDIKTYINSYDKKERTCPHCDAKVGELSVWCWLCGMELNKSGGLEQ